MIERLVIPAVIALSGIFLLVPPARADIDRAPEPVVLTGADLPGLQGMAPDHLAAFSFDRAKDRWRQVPVQVDERHTVDFLTVHANALSYSLHSLEYADPGTLSGPDADPGIDGDDEVALMARDAADRAPARVADPPGTARGSGYGIRVSDPLEPGASAWIYLFRHDGRLDPSAGRDYVDYDFDLLAGDYPGDYDFDGGPGNPIGDPPLDPAPPANPEDSRVTTGAYSEHFADRWITDELRITAGSATGVDILDRNRLGAPFVTDDPIPCPRTENTFAAGHGAFVANIDGPVRAIRDYIGANSGIYTQRRQVFYERREDLTIFLRLHPVAVGPSDLLDYTAAASGMTYRNDLMGGAVTIDGNPDDVPTGSLTWELTRGRQGSLVVSHRMETDIPDFKPTSIYRDDSSPARLPCTGDGEALGTSGPSIQSGLPRTDPTPRGDPRGAGLPVYSLTSYRTHFYEPPGATAETASRRSDEARTPLRAAVSPRGGRARLLVTRVGRRVIGSGRLNVRARCRTTGLRRCAGSLVLDVRGRAARRRIGSPTLAKRHYSVKPGSRRLRLRLDRPARKALRRDHKLEATLRWTTRQERGPAGKDRKQIVLRGPA